MDREFREPPSAKIQTAISIPIRASFIKKLQGPGRRYFQWRPGPRGRRAPRVPMAQTGPTATLSFSVLRIPPTLPPGLTVIFTSIPPAICFLALKPAVFGVLAYHY